MKIQIKTGVLPPNFIILSIFFILIGIAILIKGGWFCVFFLFIGISVLTIQFGFEIKPENHEYRKYVQIWWLKTGKWITIKNIRYLSIVKRKHIQNISMLSISSSVSVMKCNLNFIFNNKKYLTIHSAKKKNILKIASKISKALEIKIYDTTVPQMKTWLNSDLTLVEE